MTNNNSTDDIFSMSKEDYDGDYDDKLFEQYKIYLQNIDNLENRRKITHSFFLSINTALISAFGILFQFGIILEQHNQLWIIGTVIAGILFTYSWRRIINSYISLSTVKWSIILEIEKKLPLMIHNVEWKILNTKHDLKYNKLTDVESIIPLIFIGLYSLFIIGIVSSVIFQPST